MSYDLTFRAVAHIECNEYLKIIKGVKEFYIDELNIDENTQSITSVLNGSKINYKGNVIELNEYIDELNKRLNDLKTPRNYGNQLINLEIPLFNINQDYYVAIKKAEAFEKMIGKARFNLFKAIELIKSPQEIRWEHGYQGQYAVRSMYLEDGIVNYNSCDDYILQIIWFAFSLYKKHPKFNENMNHEELARLCDYFSLSKIYSENKTCGEFKKLWNILSNHRNKNITLNSWANDIKHKGNLRIKGVYIENPFHMSINNNKGIISTKDFRPNIIDLEDSIEHLENVHKNFLEYYNSVLDFINFRKPVNILERDKNITGKMVIPSKEKYMKILID